jgi:hypothetical protein
MGKSMNITICYLSTFPSYVLHFFFLLCRNVLHWSCHCEVSRVEDLCQLVSIHMSVRATSSRFAFFCLETSKFWWAGFVEKTVVKFKTALTFGLKQWELAWQRCELNRNLGQISQWLPEWAVDCWICQCCHPDIVLHEIAMSEWARSEPLW